MLSNTLKRELCTLAYFKHTLTLCRRVTDYVHTANGEKYRLLPVPRKYFFKRMLSSVIAVRCHKQMKSVIAIIRIQMSKIKHLRPK